MCLPVFLFCDIAGIKMGYHSYFLAVCLVASTADFLRQLGEQIYVTQKYKEHQRGFSGFNKEMALQHKCSQKPFSKQHTHTNTICVCMSVREVDLNLFANHFFQTGFSGVS